MINWYKHFFWLIGQAIICLIEFDFNNFIDTLFWIKIHWTIESKYVGKYKLPWKEELKHGLITFLGFIIFLLLSLLFIKVLTFIYLTFLI